MSATEQLNEVIEHCERGTTSADVHALAMEVAKLANVVLELQRQHDAESSK
jgi:hypothetical protein